VRPDTEAELERLERLAHRMDTAFRVPVLGIRLGWDSILGVIPVIGDAATLAPAVWIMWRARKLGVPATTLARMGLNTGVDALLGAVPVVGDLLDVGLKANKRNVALIRRKLEAAPQTRNGAPKDAVSSV
jgi:hypothetical protein